MDLKNLMVLHTEASEVYGRLIQSLFVSVNSPMPRSLADATKPFDWALEMSREAKKRLRQRVDFRADEPAEQSKNVKLVQSARSKARMILWWLATANDAALDEPVLVAKLGTPKISWVWLQGNAELLEAPLIFRHYTVKGDTVAENETTIWDRPSTCIAHALDLLLTDYRGLRSRVRACPFLPRGTLSDWKAERIGRDHALHFFVDDRFERGQAQWYCTPRHRQTAYMRQYRTEQARAKHK